MNYNIFLDERKIGVSKLENADAPMGMVFGKISFENESFNYLFFSDYCKRNSIEVGFEYPEDKLISTQIIPTLKVVSEQGIEIKGMGSHISGMDTDGFEINVIGIPYPFYEEQFPNHVKEYNEKFE
jgi:hypothetical protein